MTQQGYEPVVNGCFSMHDFPVRIRLVIAFGLVLLLGACATVVNPTVVTRSTAVDELQAKRRGAVTLLATEVTDGCTTTTAMIGRKDPEGYAAVRLMSGKPLSKHYYVSLEEGEYHIVRFTCLRRGFWGGKRFILGREKKRPGKAALYKKSYARFHVRAGEVVNLGMMNFYARDMSIYDLKVVNMPKSVHEGLKSRYPKMYSNMITRLMTVKFEKRG